MNALSRDAAVSYETARRYLQVLEDTLVLVRIPSWSGSDRASLVAHPKVMLFDLGVRNALLRRPLDRPLEDERGLLLEHLVGLELHRRTRDLWPDLRVFHFRTRSGAGGSASSSGGMPSSSQWMSARTARPSAALRVRPGLRAGGVANKHPEQDNSGFSREARSTWARAAQKNLFN